MLKSIFVFLAIFPGFTSVIHAEDKLRTCKKASDCVAIPSYCRSWAVVNRKSIPEARKSFDRVSAMKECRLSFAEIPKKIRCVKNLCTPEYVWADETSPPKGATDWAVKTLVDKSYNRPFKDPEGSVPLSLEIVTFFPSRVLVEKRLVDKKGKHSTNVSHQIDSLCLIINYIGGHFNDASTAEGCVRK